MRATAAATLLVALAAGTVGGVVAPAAAQQGPEVVTDVYVEMDDGVRLATDVHLPPGTPTDGSVQVPCLVEVTPYRKEVRAAEAVSFLPQAGFGVIQVDARGTGGSEGEYDIVFSVREQWDAAAMIDWAAEESGYCTDKVGMFGGSYSGIIQYLVGSLPPDRAPEHLAALAPQRAFGDLYRDIVYHGGQMIASFGALWSTGTSALYYQPPTNVDTADGQSAWTDHLANNDPMLVPYLQNPYVDATFTADDSPNAWSQDLYRDSSVLDRIERLTVPTFHLAGWFDSFTRGQLLTAQQALANEQGGTGGPHYLAVGPWNHSETHFSYHPLLRERLVEWYRHWLDDGPRPDWFGRDRIRYYTMGEGGLLDDTGSWTDTTSWPPPQVDHDRLHLTADGVLTEDAPAGGEVTWVSDPTTGVAEWPSRWDDASGAVPHADRDQSLDGDRGGPTFMTEELPEDLTLAGPLSLRLQMSSQGLPGGDGPVEGLPDALDALVPPYHDTDLVVKVSDVAPDGTATLITSGFLRASHRALDLDRSQVVDGDVVVPFHPHTRDSVQPVPVGETVEYWVEVWPTAKTFREGHRLRMDVYSADTPNHLNLLRPAVNTITTGAETYLVVPTLQDAGGPPGHVDLPDAATDRRAAAQTAGTGTALPATGGGAAALGLLLVVGAAGLRRTRRT